MKGKIKILSLVMAVAMAASMFVACSTGGTTTSSAGTTTDSKTESKAEDKPAETVEISWYFGGDAPKQPDAVYEALNAKSVADIGVKVNFKFTTGNDSTVKTALASGDKDLDIVFACAWFADYIGNAQRNCFADLTEALPTAAPTLWADYPEILWEGAKVNGKLYGVPVWKDAVAQQFWMGRQDILEAAGAVEDFQKAGLNIDSLTPTLEKVKAWHDKDPAKNLYSEGNTAPINFNWAGLNGIDNMIDVLQGSVRLGVSIIDPTNTKVESYYTMPYYLETLKTLKKWADAGLSNGKIAPTVEQEATVITVSTAQGWDGAQYSAWGGPLKGYSTLIQPKTEGILTTATAQGALNCIGSNSEKMETSLKYLEYVATNPEYRNMLTYGIEGTNWHKATADDVKEFYADAVKNGTMTEDALAKEITEVEGKVVKIDTGDQWTLWNFAAGSWKHLLPALGAKPNTNTNIMKQMDSAKPNALLGFGPTIANVETQITACAGIIEQYYKDIQCGNVKDVDAQVAKILKELDAVGYQDIIKDYQAQVDAFLAK